MVDLQKAAGILPFSLLPDPAKDRHQIHLIISALQFDHEDNFSSVSMMYLANTLHTFFNLGKIAVPNTPNFFHSWRKSYRMIQEHQILNLHTFEETRSEPEGKLPGPELKKRVQTQGSLVVGLAQYRNLMAYNERSSVTKGIRQY